MFKSGSSVHLPSTDEVSKPLLPPQGNDTVVSLSDGGWKTAEKDTHSCSSGLPSEFTEEVGITSGSV